jgi:thioredoxin reductase (NADPH)
MKPVILAVARSDEAALVDRELRRRYASDYEILACDSLDAAGDLMRALATKGQPLALILASYDPPDLRGLEVLAATSTDAPAPKRALLVRSLVARHGQPFDRSAGKPIVRALALGQFDAWIWGPWHEGDEEFHSQLTDLLRDWAGKAQPRFETLKLIGVESGPETHSLRDALQRSGVRFAFHEAKSGAGRRLLARAGLRAGDLPAAILFDDRILRRATLSDVTAALGVNADPDGTTFDLTILGAGPAGLAAAVYASSEGLHTLLVEPIALGGQAGTSPLIRNYLGFPRGLSGTELTERAFEQAWLFGTEMLIGRRALGVRAGDHARFVIPLDDGTVIGSRSVVIATGISYRRLRLPDPDQLLGRGVFYGAALSEAPAMSDERVAVVGGGNSAGQTALNLAHHASHVSLLVRGGSIRDSMSEYLVRQLESSESISIHVHTEVIGASGSGGLDTITVSTPAGERVWPARGLFVLIGAEPRTDWIEPGVARDERGYVITGSAVHDPDHRERGEFETSLPGVFAVGDVRAGSIKRVAAAVGEGSVAVRQVHGYLAGTDRRR